MTAHAHLVLPPHEEPSGRRWVFAAILVVLVHGGLVYWLSRRVEPLNPAGAPDSAIMIELPPMEAAPPAPASEASPQPPLAEPPPEPEKAPPTRAEPVPELAPAPNPELVLVAPEKPIPRVESKPEMKTIRERRETELKREEAKREEKRREEAKREEVRREEAKQEEARRAEARRAEARREAERRAGASGEASRGSAGSSMSATNWHSLILAAIIRNRPSSAQGAGRSTIAFTVDRSGRLVSASIASSSGSGALDQAALAAVRRTRFPPPPPGIGGASFNFKVPINFH